MPARNEHGRVERDGTGTGANFNSPTGIILDRLGDLVVCDSGNGTIRVITSAGVVTTLAGSAGNRGSTDGAGTAARFSRPTGIAQDNFGNYFVTDSPNDTIRMITPTGVVTTLAGVAGQAGDTDGAIANARFNNPTGLTIDPTNNDLYIADTFNNTIRKIIATNTLDPNGTITATVYSTVATWAGSAGISGSYDGDKAFSLFSLPQGLATFSNGGGTALIVADTGNNLIRAISNGYTFTLGGVAGISGFRDGTPATALFNQPQGVTFSATGSFAVLDTGNSALRLISSSSSVITPNLAPDSTGNGVVSGTPTTGLPSTGGGGFEGWLVLGLAGLWGAARWTRSRSGA